MAKKIEKEFDLSVIENIQKEISMGSAYHRKNRDDLDGSRPVGSGFGWDKKTKDFWGQIRPQITINGQRSWINELVASYDRNPFSLQITGVGAAEKEKFDKVVSKLTSIASECLRYTSNDGYDYILVHDSIKTPGTVDIKRIDARMVFHGACVSPTLDDLDIACVIDIETKSSVQSLYELTDSEMADSDLFASDAFSLIDDQKKKVAVATVYERVDDGIRISRVVKKTVVAQSTIPLKRIPLYRCFGEVVEYNGEIYYRGVHHFVASVAKAVNMLASDVQSRIAFCETANWVGPDRAILPANSSVWADNGETTGIKTYNAGTKDDPVPAPTQISKNAYVGESISALDAFRKIESDTLGAVTSEAPQGATAEEILSRNQSKQAAANGYLRNLKTTLQEVGEGVVAYLAIISLEQNDGLNYVGAEVVISDGPIAADQRLKETQTMLALFDLALKSGIPAAAQSIYMEIIGQAEIDKDRKERLIAQLSGQVKTPQQAMLEQQMAQMQQQAQVTVQENNDLKGYVARLENMLNTEVYKVNADMQKAREKNAVELEKMAAQAQIADKELGLQLMQLAAKERAEADKTAVMLEKSMPKPVLYVVGNEANTQMGRGRF